MRGWGEGEGGKKNSKKREKAFHSRLVLARPFKPKPAHGRASNDSTWIDSIYVIYVSAL